METVDADLDRLISKRASEDMRPEPDELDPGYMESVRAYEEKRRQAARLEWHLHHTAQAERLRRTLEALASHHEEQAARLMTFNRKEQRNGQEEIRQRLPGQGGNAPAYEIPWPR